MKWQDELKRNVETVEQLNEFVELSPREKSQLRRVVERHPMSITRYYLSLINRNDAADPIRRMIVPSAGELDLSGSYDPSDELSNTKMPGLQHKYSQTALILTTNRCAAYCRFCFRKRLVGLKSGEILHRVSESVAYIREHREINNVLLSGGDPFYLSTKLIELFLEMLSPIDHLDFIRFGTRIPVVFPDRILTDGKLQSVLRKYSTKDRRIHVTTHFNHPNEITGKSIEAIDRLLRSGVIVNNQTVLLRGVNDDTKILADLFHKLVGIGVNPYYLFQCRPVKRVKHTFQVGLRRGCRIVRETNRMLNGIGKRYRYVMSHLEGKIEIVGIEGDEFVFRFHEARNPKNIDKVFTRPVDGRAGWLDDLEYEQPAAELFGEHDRQSIGN